MLGRRLVEHGTMHRDMMGTSGEISRLCTMRSGSNPFAEALQRLQELDIEKREPVLLRCSALQRTRFVRMNTMQRTSEVYKVQYEFHTAVSQSMFRLVPSLETDECLVRHVFASVSGRSTRVLLRSSPIYTAHWHIISSVKQVQVKQRAVAQLSYKLILQPMEIETAERWYMTWEYVVYRVSHGVHFAIMKSITDISPRERVLYIRIQQIYPKRFIRSIIAPVQKKKLLKASESYPIMMCTVDRGEPCRVRGINIAQYRRDQLRFENPPQSQFTEIISDQVQML